MAVGRKLHLNFAANNLQPQAIMKNWWWKISGILLLLYTIIAGLNVFNQPAFEVPRLSILNETIRNLYFHVCMWFSMMIIFTVSVVNAVRYLRTNNLKYDIISRQYAGMGLLLGLLGYSTGMIWASYTWVDPNNAASASFGAIAREPKLIGTAIGLLIYLAYLVLRDSIQDIDKKARISSVYNIFAFAFLFPSLWIIPRLLPSLHPGGDGNPALNYNDIDARMRMVFYPAVIGWTLLAVWITSLKVRLAILKEKALLKS